MLTQVVAASFFSWFAGEAVRNYGDVIPSAVKGVQNMTLKQPIGVCAISEYMAECWRDSTG